MLGFVKMSALSAVLSFGLVTAYAPSEPSAATGSAKVFHDRILPDVAGSSSVRTDRVAIRAETGANGRKGDRLAAAASACGGTEWPHFAPDCMTRDDGRPRPGRVRVITIEAREGAGISVLQRVPQTEVAGR